MAVFGYCLPMSEQRRGLWWGFEKSGHCPYQLLEQGAVSFAEKVGELVSRGKCEKRPGPE